MAVESDGGEVTQLDEHVFLIPGRRGGGCNVFVIKGTQKVALIDTGLASDYEHLLSNLAVVGLGVNDVQLVLLTHEHSDHMGGIPRLPSHIITAAHSRAASKVRLNDQFSSMSGAFDGSMRQFHVDIQLEDGVVIDLGGIRLRTIYTPGHCSGAACFYDLDKGSLFTGDTVFAGGVLGGIFSSGNISDYISSLERLREMRLKAMFPGHGKMSTNPVVDIDRAINGAVALMNDTRHLFNAIQVGSSFQQIVKATASYSRRAAERRLQTRLSVNHSAILHEVEADHPVGLVDVSSGGVRLDRVINMELGTKVAITIDGVGRFDSLVVSHFQDNTRLEFLRTDNNLDTLMAWVTDLAQSKRRKK